MPTLSGFQLCPDEGAVADGIGDAWVVDGRGCGWEELIAGEASTEMYRCC